MQTYEIVVKERSVRPNSKDMTLVRTSIGVDRAHILFDNEEWLDFPISCTFAQGPDVITIPLTVRPLRDSEWVAEAECVIPYEVIDMTGSIRVTLQGTDSNGRHIITAKGSPLSVEEAGDVLEGIAPGEYPTIDQWEQVYADAQDAINDALEALADIDDHIADAIRDALDSYDFPDEYVLPVATDERLGGVKIGSGIGRSEDGTIFVTGTGDSTKINARKLDRIAEIVEATIAATYDGDELVGTVVESESIPPARLDSIGGIIPDGTSIVVDDDGMAHALAAYTPIASDTELGVVRPDGVTITVDEDGTLHGIDQYVLPVASSDVLGGVRVDGDSIRIDEDATLHTIETDPSVPAWAKEPTKPTYTADEVGAVPTGAVGTPNGVASLGDDGKVPSSQLPSYVSSVVEYDTVSDFPSVGEADKIYVDTSTNQTYRWGGSTYIEISQSLVLGETSMTAYRGDRGKAAYDHAMAKGSGYPSGLYKIATNQEGHVTSALDVTKRDIVDLGIPGEMPENVSELNNDVGYITSDDVATWESPGTVRPDGYTITVDEDGTLHGVEQTSIATTELTGKVKPDGTTITIDEDGTIHGVEHTPIATTGVAGKVKPDGDTITVDEDGTIHSIGSTTNVDKRRDPYWALVRHDSRVRLAIVIPEVT